MFENDVKQYGTQAITFCCLFAFKFANDVKQYGTQAPLRPRQQICPFENDVKQYGTQALVFCLYG